MRGRVTALTVVSVAVAGVFVCLGSMPAHGMVDATLSLGASPIGPGASITITANYTVPAIGESPTVVGIAIGRSTEGTGEIALAIDSATVPPLIGCIWSPLEGRFGWWAQCAWSGAAQGQTASITVTATASSDADGQWDVEAYELASVDPLVRSVRASASFVVAPVALTTTTVSGAEPVTSTTTTVPGAAPIAPSTTTVSSIGPVAPTTSAVPGVAPVATPPPSVPARGLPSTGARDTSMLVRFAAGFVIAGGLLIVITRRRAGHA